jgi:hypothetical protein
LLLALAVAVLVAGTLQASGAYYAIAGGITGALLVVIAGVLLVGGRVPSAPVAAFAAAFVALGAWSLASTAWGGLPHFALRFLGLLLTVAAAAVAGSCLATFSSGQHAVVGGVGLGIVAHAVIQLLAVGTHTAPSSWFEVRYLAGPVGYHNAEATILVVGLPIAIWAGASSGRFIRATGAAAAGLLVGTILLTQSRGAILAAIVSAVVQIAVSRRLRVAALSIALGATGALLFMPLRSVDRALVAGDVHAGELSAYVLYTCACALALGVLSIPEITVAWRPKRRHSLIAVAGAAVLLVGGVASAAVLSNREDGLYHRLTAEPNSTSLVPGGETRFSSVSPTGRVQQWRIAAHMAGERPFVGYGTATFARRWGHDRTILELYVLQAHSIEMELASELGLIGCALGLAAAIALGIGIARGVGGERGIGAVAAAASVGFLAQASIDWVLSFPAVAASVALVAGAASTGAVRAPGVARTVAYGAAVLVGVFVLSGPALAAFELRQAKDAGPERFASAWSSVQRARSFDRWDPAVVSYEGILAESAGRFAVAASLYGRAADLSQQPWVDWYRQARALKRAGLVAASRAKCRQATASDPLERNLRTGACRDIE